MIKIHINSLNINNIVEENTVFTWLTIKIDNFLGTTASCYVNKCL